MSPRDLFDLTDRVIVVTGGSRGLGREMAQAFAENGGDVVIAGRKADACPVAAAEIAAATVRPVVGTGFHAGRWADAEELVSFVYGRFGRCDVLVNNAGMAPLYGELSSITEELFDKVIGARTSSPARPGRRSRSGHGGDPQESVGAALYLGSAASSYTSGAVVKVDGGWVSSAG